MKKNLLGISLLTVSGLYVLLSALVIFITVLFGGEVIFGIGISIIIFFV